MDLWIIGYVYKDLIWRAELSLCRFLSASFCCRWLQIIFISGLFFERDCFFDYTRLWVTSAIKVFLAYFRLVWISFSRLLRRHGKSFNIKAQKPKFYSSTVVYFTLAALFRNPIKFKFRDCYWCILKAKFHFCSRN